MYGPNVLRALRFAAYRRAASEDGGITVFSLLMFIVMLLAAGFAIDVNNAQQARVKLQGAADAAGHAALYWSYADPDVDPVARAVFIAEQNMPTTIFGNVLATADVEFGNWNSIDRTFTPDPTNDTAVRVTTRRVASRGNAVRTFLMGFVGIDDFDITTVSVWDAEDGWCPPQTDEDGDNEKDADGQHGEGFFALGVVDIQSNNAYKDGFCIHSETHVEFNQNSTFEDTVTVSMPKQTDLVIPNSGFDKNSGLEDALASMDYNLAAFFNDFPATVDSYFDQTSPVQPAYMEDDTKVHLVTVSGGTKLSNAMLEPFAVNEVKCNGPSLTIDKDEVIENVVIVTDCKVNFSQGSAIQNATLVTTDTSDNSVNASSDFRIGASTYCNDGKGGANILTMGGLKTASGLMAYGANVIAMGDMVITAQANGLAGINFVAGGRIDATSNGEMGFCRYGPPDLFRIPVFRMVL